MVADAEQFAEADKARRALIEEANKADSVCTDTEKGESVSNMRFLLHSSNLYLSVAMAEFKDQLDVTEKEKVTKLVTELREIAVKGQAGDSSVTADAIREKISETQQASLGLFQKVRSTCSGLATYHSLFMTPRSTRSEVLRTKAQSSLQNQKRRRKTSFIRCHPSLVIMSFRIPFCLHRVPTHL